MELGGYRLAELLGRGGMGEVFRAEREGPGGIKRRAAVKRILPRYVSDREVRERFLAEARINARLEHPNIVQVLDFGDRPEPYLVLEYVEGLTAADLLRELAQARTRLPAAAAAFIVAEAASGLDYAHRRRDDQGRPLSIVHRDVSPQNVLISNDGAVKVGDFGVARANDNQFRTQAGLHVGKLVYMAPEQAEGGPVDARSDVFALGIAFWELLTISPLIPRNDPQAGLNALLKCDFTLPSQVDPRLPASLDELAGRALKRDPSQRYQSAGEFAQALRTFLHSVAPGFDSSELKRMIRKLVPASAMRGVTAFEMPAVDPAALGVAAPFAPTRALEAVPGLAPPIAAQSPAAPSGVPRASYSSSPEQPAASPAARAPIPENTSPRPASASALVAPAAGAAVASEDFSVPGIGKRGNRSLLYAAIGGIVLLAGLGALIAWRVVASEDDAPRPLPAVPAASTPVSAPVMPTPAAPPPSASLPAIFPTSIPHIRPPSMPSMPSMPALPSVALPPSNPVATNPVEGGAGPPGAPSIPPVAQAPPEPPAEPPQPPLAPPVRPGLTVPPSRPPVAAQPGRPAGTDDLAAQRQGEVTINAQLRPLRDPIRACLAITEGSGVVVEVRVHYNGALGAVDRADISGVQASEQARRCAEATIRDEVHAENVHGSLTVRHTFEY